MTTRRLAMSWFALASSGLGWLGGAAAEEPRDLASGGCPVTLDEGRVQLESSLAALEVEEDRREVSVMAMTLKLGVASWAELGFELQPMRMASQSTVPALQGFGESGVSFKVNLWGNDGGDTAAGIVAWLGLPSLTRGLGREAVEAGVLLPVTCQLPGEIELAAVVGVSAAHDEAGELAAELVMALGATRQIIGELAGTLGLESEREPGGGWAYQCVVGGELALGADLAVSANLVLGLTHLGEAVGVDAGFVWRR